ncbi:hypothetical protein [Flectobacillus major]|uniref:hypothetical protein n=1 Tax=Flectobacillus major TaxID=103 RepID=UPI0004105D53|nr:hypothetical protein [Flectobacillus major]
MKYINRIAFAYLMLCAGGSFAQDNNYDALSRLFSQTVPSGSARFQAMGGSHSALGADVSSTSGNPAGLGFYTRSEFSFTPAFQSISNGTSYIDTKKTNTSTDNFNIANIAVVFAGTDPEYKNSWRGNWSISYNRQNTLYNKVSFAARNTQSSMMDYFADVTNRDINNNGVTFNDLKDGLNFDAPNFLYASDMYYWSFLINPQGNPFAGAEAGKSVDQKYDFESTGRVSQWTIGYGGTANEKLYLGFSLGIPSFRYETRTNYSESIINYEAIRSFDFTKNLTTSASGLNLTFGGIYKHNNMVRFGASITTPTWYNIDESSSSSLKVDVDASKSGGIELSSNVLDGNNTIANRLLALGYGIAQANGTSYITNVPRLSIAPYDVNYQLRTPFKANGGVAVFFGKKGFLSADVEYVGYRSMKLSTSSNDAALSGDLAYYTDNIKRQYKNVVNFKLGGEFREGIFAARAGIAYYGDPYATTFDNESINRSQMVYSAGVGIKTNTFYIDLTGMYSQTKQAYNPYVLDDSAKFATATINNSWVKGLATFGVYF